MNSAIVYQKPCILYLCAALFERRSIDGGLNQAGVVVLQSSALRVQLRWLCSSHGWQPIGYTHRLWTFQDECHTATGL